MFICLYKSLHLFIHWHRTISLLFSTARAQVKHRRMWQRNKLERVEETRRSVEPLCLSVRLLRTSSHWHFFHWLNSRQTIDAVICEYFHFAGWNSLTATHMSTITSIPFDKFNIAPVAPACCTSELVHATHTELLWTRYTFVSIAQRNVTHKQQQKMRFILKFSHFPRAGSHTDLMQLILAWPRRLFHFPSFYKLFYGLLFRGKFSLDATNCCCF